MAYVDLKDTYYSAPIHEEYQKYLKLLWEYPPNLKFIAKPNGYRPAMRAFTKLLKPPFSFLRSEGYLPVCRWWLSTKQFVHKMCWEYYKNNRIIESLDFTLGLN